MPADRHPWSTARRSPPTPSCERRAAAVAFVTTQGFGDLLRLGREARVEDDRYDLFFRTPEPPIEHRV